MMIMVGLLLMMMMMMRYDVDEANFKQSWLRPSMHDVTETNVGPRQGRDLSKKF